MLTYPGPATEVDCTMSEEGRLFKIAWNMLTVHMLYYRW
jgi:hypothetical protein